MKSATKRIFQIFHVLTVNKTAQFCNLFMEQFQTAVIHAAVTIFY